MKRPFLKVRYWTWKAVDQTDVRGIGLMYGDQLRAHLAPAEARSLADRLHDMADKLDSSKETP